MSQSVYDYRGNPLDVGGSVSIQRQLTTGVPTATINGIQLYAPSGGGGGGMSPLPFNNIIKSSSIVTGKYLDTNAQEVNSADHKYAVYDVSNIDGTIVVTTYLTTEGKYMCLGLANGTITYRGKKPESQSAGGKGGLIVDTFDVASIDTVKVNARINGEICVYVVSNVSADEALATDFNYLNLVASPDKKAIFFGDSIVQGTGSFYNANAVRFAEQILRTDCFNLGIGGGKMSSAGTGKKNFHNVLDGVLDDNWTQVDTEIYSDPAPTGAVLSKVEEYDRFKAYKAANGLFNIDFVFICYGFNDFYTNGTLDNENNPLDRTTILGALRSALERIQAAMPRTKIYVATPSYAHFTLDGVEIDTDITPDSMGDYLWEIGDEIEKVCKAYHIPCHHQYYKNNVNANNYNEYLVDGIHRTVKGYMLLGEQYAKFILSN